MSTAASFQNLAAKPKALSNSTHAGLLLQRKCECGSPTSSLTGECAECKTKKVLQTKLSIGASNDPLEQEADRVADQVLAAPSNPAVSGAPPHIQRLTGQATGQTDTAPASVDRVLASPGSPLGPVLRQDMEQRFGHDFSRVRVHTGALAEQSAQDIDANAYTMGHAIVFDAGRFAPGTQEGRRLIAHELTHVVQQSGVDGIRVDQRDEKQGLSSISLVREFALGATDSPAQAEADGVPEAVASRKPAQQVTTLAQGSIIQRKKEDAKGPPPYERIKKLLSRSISDWAVTDDEALAALNILLTLKPKEMLETIVRMKYSGLWKRLYEQLPANSPVDFDYFAMDPLNRTTGYIMPGDRINLDIYVSGKIDKKASGEYSVHEDGVRLNDNKNEYLLPEFRGELKEPIQIGEMMPKTAIDKIAKFFIDHLIYPGARFWLSVTTRGQLWGPEAGTVRGIPVESTYTKPNTPESLLRDKGFRFAEFAATRGTDKHIHLILGFYWHEVDNNLERWKTPEDLWAWAQTQASKSPPKSPIEPFHSFYLVLKKELDFVSAVNRETWQDAMDRYTKWLDAHIGDPDLGKYTPGDIWKKAIRGAITVEAKRASDEFLLKAKDRREHPPIDWDAAGKKLDQALEFIKKKVYHTPEPQYLEAKSEGISYLVGASDEEKLIRHKIGDDFLHDVVSRMGNPDFLRSSVEDDYGYYLSMHDDEKRILELTESHPYVEHFELEKEEIPGWQTTIEIAVGFIPIVGQVVGAVEAVAGYDMFGNPLSNTERAILGASILLPAAGKIYKEGKALYKVEKFAEMYRLSTAEADALYRVTAGIKPGSAGALLLRKTADEIKVAKAGTAIKDPKTLEKLEKVLQDMHLTDRETVQALKRPGSLIEGVERQADEIAEKEIKNIAATTEGALNDDTMKLLKQKPALRSALAENSLAERALKKCSSPCYPPNATPDQIHALEQHLERLKATGQYHEPNLREFLYKNRDDLDKAIGDVMASKTSRQLDEFLRNRMLAEFPVGPRLPPREDPRVRGLMVERSHDIGVMHGRAYATGELKLRGFGFKNPFERFGKYGQGFDDIMVVGGDLETGIVYIVEYKGGGVGLDAGQMELDWVVGNIRRLFREGDKAGQELARDLSKALREGRLKGVALSTPLEGNIAKETKELANWDYDVKKLGSKLGF